MADKRAPKRQAWAQRVDQDGGTPSGSEETQTGSAAQKLPQRHSGVTLPSPPQENPHHPNPLRGRAASSRWSQVCASMRQATSHVYGPDAEPLGSCRKSPMPQSAGEGPAAPGGLFRGRDLVVWVAALSRPCYTQTRTPSKVLPAGIPEDSRVLVTPCSSCYLGAGSLHTGSPHVEQGHGGSRLRTTVRVGRARRAPRVLQAVCNLLSLEAGFHPGDTSTARTPGPRGAPANTQPTQAQHPPRSRALSSFAWSSLNFQASLSSWCREDGVSGQPRPAPDPHGAPAAPSSRGGWRTQRAWAWGASTALLPA